MVLPTEHISLFVDSFPEATSTPGYPPDFLRRILGIQHQVPSTAIIGTFDVSSLYTNIPHDEGIDACSKDLAESGHTSPPHHRHCDPHESCTNQEQFHFLG